MMSAAPLACSFDVNNVSKCSRAAAQIDSPVHLCQCPVDLGQFPDNAIPDHDVTLRTPYVLHPSWQTEGRTFLIMDEGQHTRETHLCVRSY